MNKTLYLCDKETMYTYEINFDENVLKEQINNLLNLNLESYYINNDTVHSTYNRYTNIQSSYDLIVYLKKTFLESEIIDLSEIKNLIVSNNSRMRTPQTISAIARILENIDYKLIKKEDITRLKISIKSTYLNKLISYIDNDSNIIDVATKNKSVYNNLRIDLPKEIENEKTTPSGTPLHRGRNERKKSYQCFNVAHPPPV